MAILLSFPAFDSRFESLKAALSFLARLRRRNLPLLLVFLSYASILMDLCYSFTHAFYADALSSFSERWLAQESTTFRITTRLPVLHFLSKRTHHSRRKETIPSRLRASSTQFFLRKAAAATWTESARRSRNTCPAPIATRRAIRRGTSWHACARDSGKRFSMSPRTTGRLGYRWTCMRLIHDSRTEAFSHPPPTNANTVKDVDKHEAQGQAYAVWKPMLKQGLYSCSLAMISRQFR